LILSELERIERQVSSLLRFSRRDEFVFVELDLGELVRQIVLDLRPRLENSGIAVEASVDGPPCCRADREKLRQVLINLIENARDALGGQSAGQISVVAAGANGRLNVWVNDNGPGIPDDALAKIFEPFFTLKRSGTGLGLAIARRTIEAHGGRITAARTSGSGMSFRIDLPAATCRTSRSFPLPSSLR